MHIFQRGIQFQHEKTTKLYNLMRRNLSTFAQQMVCLAQGKLCSLCSLSQEINSVMFCFPGENVTDGALWPGYTL